MMKIKKLSLGNKRLLRSMASLDKKVCGELGYAYSHMPWRYKNFKLNLPGKTTYSFVADGNRGDLAGFCVASLAAPDTVHIHRLAVSAGYRNEGLAKGLIAKIEKKAGSFNKNAITASVSVLNRGALFFYKKLGFKKISGRKLKEFMKERNRPGKACGGYVMENDSYKYYILRRDLKR